MTREEAIHQLEDAKDGYQEFLSDEALDMAIQALEQTRWIPVTEKLPDKSDNYLCMIRFTKGRYLPMISGYAKSLYKLSKYDFPDKKGKGGWFGHDSEYGYYENTDVVAWMPIPTYKGVE